jgi:oligopeptide/dipeptide ABC transporter ATP-binding protein
MQAEPLLRVTNLHKHYPLARGLSGLFSATQREVRALDGISFEMPRGEILGLVGESGSGKSTTALAVMGLIPPTSGEIILNGLPIAEHKRLILRREVQMIFQDPYEALNPRQTVFEIVAEPLTIHGIARNRKAQEPLVAAALAAAGLKPPEIYFDRYPDELSGGQRQRVIIAGALVLEPMFLVADEPVSMLDVSIRAEILNLLKSLRDERGVTILYITHDLATAGFFTDRIAVMYLGRIVEMGKTSSVLTNPQHPYTKALLSVIPAPNPRRRRERVVLKGEIPNAASIPGGCRFHPRCPLATDRCRVEDPALRVISANQSAACLLLDEQKSPAGR